MKMRITQLAGGRIVAEPISESATPRAPVKRTTKPVATPSRAVKKRETVVDGLSAMKLAKLTPPYVKSKAKSVIIKSLKPAKTKGGMFAVRAVAMDLGTAGRPHRCHVIGLDKGIQSIFGRGQVAQVSCDCEFYCFTCEYALWKHGAAKIIHSNGEPASTTNPSSRPLLCKHLYALLGELKKHGY